jgi:hypothetical protein
MTSIARNGMRFGSSADLGSGPEPQLAQDLSDVVAGGALGDRQLGGDLAVGEAPSDEDYNLALSGGKLVPRSVVGW